ncbi:MAG: hypothetical protein UV82_C0011G0048 [Candidatus Magasanikbacteria bacterium GW2011_GWD2_43_18]|uniref:Uncharacterized protein n=1 Tax=Candidatus Magasanikbacteria bacterium GW2011_GWE2_42_7 TaxID=1619052 RepID=A0A0G1BDS4_9BACT|nr:MAG: hypothetical protein UV18_C0007G0051 [Candidatus Magasanikbacteria bacterium GW2011_GWC2_42_27]KKS71530.1 MAG: hypothetical protein UV42_C0025G0009 [Candidatus Magasanikbacteria bacterium GW2011_GWE2_42_7]KKT04120.1 MAG: hypothetical protein UV82_C0011G0048 [Candidatus Magasanikbacteria bacterium GW2011_GWD2_43_18]KKT25701.1 MAG: hypothetical protein UW10_C0005G0068 [Candidatus Magasanikbacteria bacterium GW2011_GWA2_43_9]HBB38521.1 hypothetical protein [Candidatus Magasanikbacteria bac
MSASKWEPVQDVGLLADQEDQQHDEDPHALENVHDDGHIPLSRTSRTQILGLLDRETILGAERTLDAVHIVVNEDVSRKHTFRDNAFAGSKMYGLAIIHNTGFAADMIGLYRNLAPTKVWHPHVADATKFIAHSRPLRLERETNEIELHESPLHRVGKAPCLRIAKQKMYLLSIVYTQKN